LQVVVEVLEHLTEVELVVLEVTEHHLFLLIQVILTQLQLVAVEQVAHQAQMVLTLYCQERVLLQ
jgi:hypothetical protein